MSRFQIAVAQPRTQLSDDAAADAQANLATAATLARDAAAGGASLICFPETFPGSWRAPAARETLPELQAIAREAGIHVVGSYIEPTGASAASHWVTGSLIDPAGTEVGRYRRTIPNLSPWIYSGGPFWEFDWARGDELPVFETDLGTIGILFCSEVYAPELSRILALKGAELIVYPSGALVADHPFARTWRVMTWARAIENLAYTATCNNVIPGRDEAFAMICSPEEVLVEATEPGLHYATLDLDYVRELRAEEDKRTINPDGTRAANIRITKPGNLRDWRRQELFDASPELSTVPAPVSR